MAHKTREQMFEERCDFILDYLKTHGPSLSRSMADELVQMNNRNAVTSHEIGRCLRIMEGKGLVKGTPVFGGGLGSGMRIWEAVE